LLLSAGIHCCHLTTASTRCGRNPSPDAILIASLSVAPWDRSVARSDGATSIKKKLKPYPIEFFRIRIAEVQPPKEKLSSSSLDVRHGSISNHSRN